MKRAVLLMVCALMGTSFALIGPTLTERLATAGTDELIAVDVALNEQFDARTLTEMVDGMPKPEKRAMVARILKEYNAVEQAELLGRLAELAVDGSVRSVKSHWLVNMVYCEATPAVIEELAKRSDVWFVQADVRHVPGLLPAVAVSDATDSGGDEIDWGVQKVNAPDVWALGYTGQGIVVGDIDTGCNHNHLDLTSHMWTDSNYPNHGWDFENNDNDPMDSNGHGTHTCGSVASDGTAGSQCGVAPDAMIMSCRVRTVADSLAETQVWEAMEFVVSPPLSPTNGGDIITMSLGWRNAWDPMRKLWRDGCNNVGAAGVIMIVAAGNERSTSPPYSTRTPGDAPPPWWNPQNVGTGALSNVISIGATDSDDDYASFSSRGPSEWGTVNGYNDYPYPPGLTRPDVAAPGVDIKSCRHSSNNGYTTMSGTSMATPHTAGVAALMLSKNPALSPAVVDSILEVTSVDLGPTGKDMDYGAGRIDALAAINHITGSGGPMLVMQGMTVLDPGGNNNGRVDPGETAQLEMTLRNTGGAACNNTAGTLTSGDARLVVSDANGTWGNIPSGGSQTNSSDRFEVQANSNIPQGTSVPCTLHVTGDSADYENTFVFNLVVGEPPVPGQLLMDHDTGYCRLTVSCFGPIGYDLPPSDAGNGFQYPKGSSSALFYSSFAVGTSPSYVADRHFSQPASGTPNQDLRVTDSLRPVTPPAAGDEHFRGGFDDSGHPSSKNLVITQNSHQVAMSGYDDFVVLIYDIHNNGGSAVNGLYAGVFADFDIGSSPTTNTCGSDEGRRFTWMRQASSANPTVGVKILYPYSFANLTAIDHARYVYPDSCMTDGQKFRLMDGTIQQRNSNRSYDWSMITSAGPFNLAAGETQRFAVAFCGGTSEANALAHADSAQSWFDGNVGVLELPGSEPAARIVGVAPNPFTGRARISYQATTGGRVRVTAFDITGRNRVELFDEVVAAGRGEVVWQPKELADGIYFIRLEGPDGVATARVLHTR